MLLFDGDDVRDAMVYETDEHDVFAGARVVLEMRRERRNRRIRLTTSLMI